jgi:hypothetical protein
LKCDGEFDGADIFAVQRPDERIVFAALDAKTIVVNYAPVRTNFSVVRLPGNAGVASKAQDPN